MLDLSINRIIQKGLLLLILLLFFVCFVFFTPGEKYSYCTWMAVFLIGNDSVVFDGKTPRFLTQTSIFCFLLQV